MSDEKKPFSIVSQVVPEETGANTGFHVLVENPKTIYRAIGRAARRETHDVKLQDDQINDRMCSWLTTKMQSYNHQSAYSPGTYSFDMEMDFQGRKPSSLSFLRGYLNLEQREKIQDALKNNGYQDITTYDLDGVNVLTFVYNGNQYRMRMGFPDIETHKKWIEKQIEKEKQEDRMGYYRAHPELLTGELVNDNLALSSQYFPYSPDLNLQGAFEFSNKIGEFASVSEQFVKLIYQVNSLPEPDKTVTLRAGF